jgi:superfamily II DNA or RNA helicase
MRKWDGYIEFFKKDSGRFLTGLLPEVRAALKHYGTEYTEADARLPLTFGVDTVDDRFLPGITMRDYQVDYINQAIRHHRGVVFSPTGSGKSFILVGILKALKENTPTLVLCNRKGLVDQNYEEIKKFGFDKVGRIYDQICEPGVITCMTWQSWDKFKDRAKYVRALLVDEVHDMMSAGVTAVYRQLPNCSVRIGLSATPFKEGGKDMKHKYEVKGYIGPVLLVSSIEGGKPTTHSLQERDILSEAEVTFHEYKGPELPPHLIWTDVVTHGIAENQDFHDTVSQLALAQKGRTLIIVERIKQGDFLQDRIPDALWVRGQDNLKTRKEVIERLKTDTGNTVAIATAGIFNTGINVFLHNLINAAGGKAAHTIIQRFGRGLRLANDKERLLYFDFLFRNNSYLEKHSMKRIDILKKEGHVVHVRPPFDYMG